VAAQGARHQGIYARLRRAMGRPSLALTYHLAL